MGLFEIDGAGNLSIEQSILDHVNDGKIPKCPNCKSEFREVSKDILNGELAGTRYVCYYCGKRLLVIND